MIDPDLAAHGDLALENDPDVAGKPVVGDVDIVSFVMPRTCGLAEMLDIGAA